MPIIQLETRIKANIEICFDLATSIELHSISTATTNEKAIAGTTTGLIKMGETVTWEATHLGIRQKLTSKITGFSRPFHFRDEQVKGAFKCFTHDHYFETDGEMVIMRDVFNYESPLGIIGRIFNTLVLTRYMTRFLSIRNQLIREYAENGSWRAILHQ